MRKLLLGAALAFSSVLMSAHASEPVAGQHYTALRSALPVSSAEKIEVVEVFWYGCGHCYHFEPALNAWAKELPDDVVFKRIPAQFNELWQTHARLFITLEVMKVEHQVHSAIFAGIHEAQDVRLTGTRNGQRLVLPTVESMASFLEGYGIDKAAFTKTYNSFAVQNKLKSYGQLVASSQISGVPALIVNGKYRLDIGSAGGVPEVLQVTDYLIEKERAN